MRSSAQLPTWLPQLPALRALLLNKETPHRSPGSASAPALDSTLRPLTQLTTHMLSWPEQEQFMGFPRVPASLAGLSQVQRFSWNAAAPALPALPGGPLLASRRWVQAPANVAAASRQVLAVATKLERLDLLLGEHWSSSRQLQVLQWAGDRSLRHLTLVEQLLAGASGRGSGGAG